MSVIGRDKAKIVSFLIATVLVGAYTAVWRLPLGKAFNLSDARKIKLKEVKTFKGYHKGFFSPDSRLLALMDKDHADVVEVATGRNLYRIFLPTSLFLNIAFSPDGRLLAAAYREKVGENMSVKVALWDASTGKGIQALPVIDQDWGREIDLSFSRDNRLLATNLGGVARLWDVSSRRDVRQFPPPSELPGVVPQRTLLSPDGAWLAVYFKDWDVRRRYDAVHVWELATGRKKVLETSVYRDWMFSPDSSMLATTASADVGKITQRAVAEVWEVGSWDRTRVIEVPQAWQGAFTLCFSPSGKILAVGGRSNFGMFSIRTGELIAEERHHGKHFWASDTIIFDLSHVEFSPDGRLLLTGLGKGTVKLWSLGQGAV